VPAKRQTAPPPPPPRRGTALLIRNTLLWMVPVAVIWWLATPVYNRVLLRSAGGILYLCEHPAVTDLLAKGDLPPARSLVYPFRVSDVHFHLLLLGALFLAVPGIPWRERLGNLAAAVLITFAYDALLVVFIVESTYATHLGAWSLAHYGAFARNFYGLGKHLLDLPFKLALPLLLWCAFYLPRLRAASPAAAAPPPR
jgi:hypothetical protein